MKKAKSLLPITLSFVTFTTGCIADPDSDETRVASESSPIVGGSRVTQSYWLARTVSVGGYCTGVIIGQRHIATAAHCTPRIGDAIGFYSDADTISWTGSIQAVYERYGVDAANNDLEDTAGKFADFAVLRLATDIPAGNRFANPSPSYPSTGEGTFFQVGRGRHDGNPNPTGELRWVRNWLNSYDTDGSFWTEYDQVNPGDSGGPAYAFPTNGSVPTMVYGVLFGTFFDYGKVRYVDQYTSFNQHYRALLAAMGEAGRFNGGTAYAGSTYKTMTRATRDECSMACMQEARCYAYVFDYGLDACSLLESYGGTKAVASNVFSGRKDVSRCLSLSGNICRVSSTQLTN